MKYSHTYNVILDNMDMQEYRLRPISAIMYLQDAFARYCGTKRVAAYDLFSQNLIWVVGEFNIVFLSILPYWSEEIEVNIWISEITKLKIYADYELSYQNKPFAKGNSCWFLLNDTSKRPVKTDVIADKFVICNELTLGEHKKFSLSEEKEAIKTITHKTNLSDIDFNNHVNNKSYINIANATLDKDFKLTHFLKKMNVKFMKEAFIDEVLTCTTYRTDDSNTFIHKIEKDGDAVCDISTVWELKGEQTEISTYPLQIRSF